jgi:hypothetical protein
MTPADATRETLAALGAAGLADVRSVRSRPTGDAHGSLSGSVRTDVQLCRWGDLHAVTEALATLPGVLALAATGEGIALYRRHS